MKETLRRKLHIAPVLDARNINHKMRFNKVDLIIDFQKICIQR